MQGIFFLQPWGAYASRDVAFFEDEQAERIIKLRGQGGSLIARRASDAEIKGGRKSIDPEEYQAHDKGEPVPVMFDRSVGGYNTGEIAWFVPSVADSIIGAGAGHTPSKAELKSTTKVIVAKTAGPRVMLRMRRPVAPLNVGEIGAYDLAEARVLVLKRFAEPADDDAAALLRPEAEPAGAAT